ncbi:MAG: DUF2341 domain-containing protein [Nannocystaceae bacterium]|nr:DUF2341 domain-containing protein [Nannocystaceae bacterium]
MILLWAAACSPQPDFRCEDASQCVLDGVAGQCEPLGYCSYPDMACASGRRYGRYAGAGLVEACLPEDDASTTAVSPTSSSSSGEPSSASGSSSDASSSSGPSSESSSTSGDPPIPADWWNANWRSRVRLTVEPGPGSEALVDVPLLVILEPDRIAYEHTTGDGRDVRILDPLTQELLPLEVERWDPEGRSFLWVRLPELPTDTASNLELYYDNPKAEALDGTQVWSAGYVGVWHLGDWADSSASKLDADAKTSTALFVPAKAGDGVRLTDETDPTGLQVEVPSAPAIVDIFSGPGGTAEVWFRMDEVDGGQQLLNKSSTGFGVDGWTLKTFQDDRIEFRREVGGFLTQYVMPRSISLDTWHHAAVVYADDAAKAGPTLYFDGVPVDVEIFVPAQGGTPVSDNGEPLIIGNDQLQERRFPGDIDEVRLSDVPRSASFLLAQFESMNDRMIEWGETDRIDSR